MANYSKVNRADLLRAIAFCAPFTEASRTAAPILSCIHIKGGGGAPLTATATDLETVVVAPIPAVPHLAPLDFVVHGTRIKNWLSLLPDDRPIDITCHPNNWVTFEHKGGRAKMAGHERSAYPEIPSVAGETFSAKLAPLISAVQRIEISVPSEEGRFTIPAALFDTAKKALVSTDGHRLTFCEFTLGEGNKMLVPGRGLEALLAMAKLCDSEDVSIGVVPGDRAVGRDFYHFSAGGFMVGCRALTSQNFPDYDRVLQSASDFLAKVTLDRVELTAALKRVMTQSDIRSRSVTLTLADGSLALSAKDAATSGEASDEIPADYSGPEPLVATFNSTYISDFLKSSSSEKIRYCCGGPQKASEFGDGNVRYVLMPMRP